MAKKFDGNLKREIETNYRPEIATPPPNMAHLPIFRGYPVPWFVGWPDGEDGEPEFRVADGKKRVLAVTGKLCWVCGQKLGTKFTFVLGPMCGVTRTTAEPPCHKDCATYSALNCPFLSKPQMVRRDNDMPDNTTDAPGFMIRRNPGVAALWTTKSYQIFGDGNGGFLIKTGDPISVEWYRLGRKANRAEVDDSVNSGLPLLMEKAKEEGQQAILELEKLVEVFRMKHCPLV